MAHAPDNEFKPSAVRRSQDMELVIQCHDVVKKDFSSNSDPYVRVWQKRTNWYDPKTKQKIEGFVEIGQTEVIKDNPNPIFRTKIPIEYYFEEEQVLAFECWDYDGEKHKHDFIGKCSMDFGDILASPGSIKVERLLSYKGKPLKNKKTKMYQTLQAELNEVNKMNRDVLLQIGPENLAKMDMFGSSDAYFKIYRIENNKKILLFNKRITEDAANKKDGWVLWNHKKNKVKTWPKFTLSLQDLCECDIDNECINIEVWDADKDSNDDLIGDCTYTFKELQEKKSKHLHKQKHKNKDRGTIKIFQCKVLPSMVDFIQGGCDISMICSIDLTGSNGDPSDEISLHHATPLQPSQYQKAIRAIGNISAKYDTDQQFPVYGFGLAIQQQGNWKVHHTLELNKYINWQGKPAKNNDNPAEVPGVYGIEQLYIHTLKTIQTNPSWQLSGPTFFSPVIKEAVKFAKESHDYLIQSAKEGKLKYHILLLLTDGAITKADEQNTKDLIVDAANRGFPLSIIAIGIGDADFGFLEQLDADDTGFYNSKGELLQRDIVQFVKFNDYKKHGMYEKLAKDTLKEIPKQFMSYITMNDIPAPKRTQFIQANAQKQFEISELEQKQTMYSELNDANQLNDNQYVAGNDPFENAPLPPSWQRAYTDDGKTYYINHVSKVTQWTHPDDPRGNANS